MLEDQNNMTATDVVMEIQETLSDAGVPAGDVSSLTPEISEVLFQAVVSRASVLLTHTEEKEFSALLDGNASADQIFHFLLDHVPNFELIIKEELWDLKNSLGV